MGLKEMRLVEVDWIHLAQNKEVASACKCRNENFGFRKMRGISGLFAGVLSHKKKTRALELF
jgi:hypothetical protein